MIGMGRDITSTPDMAHPAPEKKVYVKAFLDVVYTCQVQLSYSYYLSSLMLFKAPY
jgi:hypothetical protein